MRIGLIQMAVESGEKERNVARAFSLMEEAACQCDLIVLPELWTVGYDFRRLSAQADHLGEGLPERLASFAAARGVALAAGTLPIEKEGKLYNMGLVFDRRGRLAGTYCKQHLFEGYLEAALMTPGQGLMQARLGEAVCGMGICYELYFPELFRPMAASGMTMALLPASWPLGNIERWGILARARAIENGMYLCAVNTAGAYHGRILGGHSLFIDPEGHVQAEGGTGEEILYGNYEEDKYPALGSGRPVIRRAMPSADRGSSL